MAHSLNRFVLPQVGFASNDAELRKLQKNMLFEEYKRQTEERERKSRVHAVDKDYWGKIDENPENPLYRSEKQIRMDKNIKHELANFYHQELTRKQSIKKYQKQEVKRAEQQALLQSKQIEAGERMRSLEMHDKFRREAIQQVHDQQRRKLKQKQKQQEQKINIQRRYTSNLQSLNKQKSFKQHFHNVNDMLAQNQLQYLSTVLPRNNQREMEKQKLIQEGIRRRDNRLREQLQNQSSIVATYRKDLRDCLTQQIREKEDKKKKDLASERAIGYTSMNYQAKHHPINNPVDFRMNHDNRIIIRELQSGLARSGSHAVLSS